MQTTISTDSERYISSYLYTLVISAWTIANNCFEIRTATFVAKLISSVPNNNEQSCEICKCVCKDIFIHASFSCPSTSDMCSNWWDLLIEKFPVYLYVELSECDEESIFRILFGKESSKDLCSSDLDAFKRLFYIHLVKSSAEYNRILQSSRNCIWVWWFQ